MIDRTRRKVLYRQAHDDLRYAEHLACSAQYMRHRAELLAKARHYHARGKRLLSFLTPPGFICPIACTD